jgi:UDP:flavonoid glycosyltransferase YjiC (YdhE family)
MEGDASDHAINPLAMMDLLMLMDEQMEQEIRIHPPAFALVDAATIWGRLLAEKYRIPMILSSAPMIINRLTMKEYFRYFEQLMQILETGVMEEKLEEAAKAGFPKKEIYALYTVEQEENCIVYVSKELQPCADQMQSYHIFYAGYVNDEKEGRDNSLEDEAGLKAGGERDAAPPDTEHERSSSRPLIYISMGTSSINTGFFFKNCVTAFQNREELDIVMAVCSEEIVKQLGDLPGHIRAYPYVDQKEILKKADVVIFHGGLNTLRDSLVAGVPMIICPRAFDQEGNAKRVEELGAGIALANNRPETLWRAVRLMLSVPSYRENSFRVGQTLLRSGTVEEAARWILSCIGSEDAS